MLDTPDAAMTDTPLIDRLRALHGLAGVPDRELEWLIAHGTLNRVAAGEVMLPTGAPIDFLQIVLAGCIAIHVDRGAGSRRTMEWRTGDVTGRLPFSRVQGAPGRSLVEEDAEMLSVHRDVFPELVRECPEFTARCVHTMIDRARIFTSTDLQEEKMLSLGKLAAGLAHELNNPASAASRSADELTRSVRDLETTAVALGAAGLSSSGYDAVARLQRAHVQGRRSSRSTLEQADWEDEVRDWVEAHGIQDLAVDPLADSAVTIELLDEVAAALTPDQLSTAIAWFVAGHTARRLSSDIEIATGRIYSLVAAVKGFTYMDQAATPMPVDVARGLRDTLAVLRAKAKGNGIEVELETAPDLPKVVGLGGELNQVWSNLVDNALDAVPRGGRVSIRAARNGDCLDVRVTDNGPGVPDAIRDRIFDPFFTTKPPGSGTGLGLDIVRRLVRKHGGEVRVKSEPGRTEFVVSLPAANQ